MIYTKYGILATIIMTTETRVTTAGVGSHIVVQELPSRFQCILDHNQVTVLILKVPMTRNFLLSCSKELSK